MKVGDVNGFLSTCGFTTIEIVDDKILRDSYLKTEGLGQETLAVGECLGFAKAGI